MAKEPGKAKRRHDRRPTERQRDERVKLEIDPDDALRVLLGVPIAADPDAPKKSSKKDA